MPTSGSASAVDLKKSVLDLASSGSAHEFAATIVKLGKKNSQAALTLSELVTVFKPSELEQLWSSLIQRKWFATSIGAIEGTDDETLFKELDSNPEDTHVTKGRQEAVDALQAIATLLLQYVQKVKPSSVSEDCLALACNLHDLLFDLSQDADAGLQKTIGKYCEIWCLQKIQGFENMVSRLIPLLLFTALSEEARGVDLQRLYGLRSVLGLFEMDDPSSESLKVQLLNCFISPHFLGDKTGMKFLVHVFSMSGAMMHYVHDAIKNQIPYAKKSVLVCYGELYFSVWSACGDNAAAQSHFETKCLQNLFEHAIHARKEVFKNVMRVLSPIHEHKRDSKQQSGEMDAMLLRLYGPILWRSFKVANATVRRNSIVLLADLFPLQDSSLTQHSEIEALSTRQHDAFRDALMDPSPEVRVVAIEGASRVLGTYWEIVPENYKKDYINCFVKKLVYDQSSWAVRAAVFDGLNFVLDNRLCHSVMKHVLPALAPFIHDKSERVRTKMLDMLLQVKRIRDIQFYDVVPVEDLLERLAEDAKRPALAKKLTSLLLNSYFPDNKGVRERLSRAKTLMEQNPPAAVAFYSNLRQHVAVSDVCSLLDALNKCMVTILKHMGTKQGSGSRKRSLGAGDDVQDSSSTEALKSHATKVLLLLHVVTGTWESISKDLSKRGGAKAAEYLRAALSGDFCDDARAGLEGFFSPGIVEALLCRLAALLEADDCESFQASILPKLSALAAKGAVEAEYAPLVELSCQWELEGELIEYALSCIEAGFNSAPAATRGRSKRSLKGAKGGDVTAANASFATNLLLLIITKNFSGARDRLLESPEVWERMQECFSKTLPAINGRLENMNSGEAATLSNEALVNLLSCAFKMHIHNEWHRHQHYGTTDESQSQFCSMLEEMTRNVIPFFGASTPAVPQDSGASPARQRRRKKENGSHTPAHLAKSSKTPFKGATQQLLWSVATVAAATAHDFLAIELNNIESTTAVLRFFAALSDGVADASNSAATRTFSSEAAAIYRYSAASLAIVADPEMTELTSLDQWRGEQASYAERAFLGVLRINAMASIENSAQLIPDFLSKFVFSQPVLAQVFVPVLVSMVVHGGQLGAGTPTPAQSKNISLQNSTITSQLVAQAGRDSAVFQTACNSVLEAIDEVGVSGAKSTLNGAFRLLTKLISNADNEEEVSRSTVDETVKSTMHRVNSWLANKQKGTTCDDAENAAPVQNAPAANTFSKSSTTAADLSAFYNGTLATEVVGGFLGALSSQLS